MSCYIVFPSLTSAQCFDAALRRKGVPSSLVKTPRELEEKGCSYGIRIVDRWMEEAMDIMGKSGIGKYRVYLRDGEGYREVTT